MILDVSKALKAPGIVFAFHTEVELPTQDFMGDEVSFSAPVSVSGSFTGVDESVAFQGEVEATVALRCALCLEPVKLSVKADFDELFMQEVDPQNPDRFVLSGTMAEISDMVQAAIFAELPMRVLCKDDCRGLCPVCGTNQNYSQCSCLKGLKRQNPFSALEQLLIDDEEV